MSDNENCSAPNKRTPWNKGKLIGARPPLRPKHVWSIRTRLLLEGRIRDLALFNLAIDSKLRGCDVVAVRVEDVAPNGYTMDRANLPRRYGPITDLLGATKPRDKKPANGRRIGRRTKCC
jgi:hypothetical protein